MLNDDQSLEDMFEKTINQRSLGNDLNIVFLYSN